MILRRFTKHVNDQNWFAVFLDLIVVIVGIYIGLQVSAWNAANKDRALEVEYLERLLADMDESVVEQLALRDLFDESIVSIDYIAGRLHVGNLEDADQEKLIVGMNSIGWVAPPATNMVTIRELQSTGKISLIRDVSVRMAIGRFDRSYAAVEFSAAQNIAFMAASAPEIMTWSYMRPRVPGEHRSIPQADDLSFGYDHHFDFERMLQNPDGVNIASWISGWSKYHGAVLEGHRADTIAFREMLREKVEQHR